MRVTPEHAVRDAASKSPPDRRLREHGKHHTRLSRRTVNRDASVLGFDYGARRIGVAVGHALSGARPLQVVPNGANGPAWPRIDALLREWRPQRLLVGLPLTLDGGEQRNSRAARDFAASLEQRYDLPTQLVDERLSSHDAARRFAERRAQGRARRKHAANLDADAAAIIVETWLAHADSIAE